MRGSLGSEGVGALLQKLCRFFIPLGYTRHNIYLMLRNVGNYFDQQSIAKFGLAIQGGGRQTGMGRYRVDLRVAETNLGDEADRCGKEAGPFVVQR